MTNNQYISTQTQNKQQIYVLCGIAIPIVFTLLIIVESLLRPGYSQISNFISDLGVGPYSLIQNMNFIISGILSIVFAIVLGASLPANRSGKATKWMVILFGLGTIFAGVALILSWIYFGESPTNYVFYLYHTLASFIAFLTIIAAQILTWQALKKSDSTIWGNYPIYSLVSGLLSIILLIVFMSTFSSPYTGLTERLFVAVPLIWLGITGLKLYKMIKK